MSIAIVALSMPCACRHSEPSEPPAESKLAADPESRSPSEVPRADPDAFDNLCDEDQDCVPAPSCCPTPCTSEVINVRDLPRARAKLARCPKDEECPSASACRTHAYLCVASHCALVFAGDPAYRAR